MNKPLGSFRMGLLLSGLLILMAFALPACKKSNDIDNNTPLAALIGFNLSPDKAAIGISISGSYLTNTPLNYTSFTGGYQTIYPGTREIASYDFGTSTPFATTTQNFEVNKYYSVFTLGANGTYRNVVVKDELDTLTAASGQAFVRYINAIPDSSKAAVTITANGTELSNINTSYATVSSFTSINPGDITIKVANGTNINASRTITLEKSKIYTILLVGIPGSADPAKLVQIKFISNGTL